MEIKEMLPNIENLKTSTSVKELKDKEGMVVERRVVTKVQFECEVLPAALANVHRLLAADAPVDVEISSPQAIMEAIEHEPVFAEV